MQESKGPLSGVRVVEFDTIGPVPLAAMILADMGTDVVRVIRPPHRHAAWDDVAGAVLHRGRLHLQLDLKDPAHREQALTLVAGADALIEGFRPGVMERLGLGPEPCLEANPGLVYARMTGWGQSGPLAPRAGHDINYIAVTGALHAMGAPGEPPPVPLNLVGDYGGGTMFALVGMLAALLHARATGEGQIVDVAMTDGVAVLTSLYHGFRASGGWRDERGTNLLDGSVPFYRCYACADGGFVAVGALEPQFFALLLAGLQIAPGSWVQNDRRCWPRMAAAFAEIFASRPRDHWAVVFGPVDACVTPVLSFAEARAHPHNAARGTIVVADGIEQPAPAPRFSRTPGSIRANGGGSTSTSEVLARWPSRLLQKLGHE